MSRSRLAFVICVATAAACTAQPQVTAEAAPASEGAASGMSAANPSASEPSAVAARAPERREITIPADTSLSLELATPVSSEDSSREDPVEAKLRRAIVVNGETVVPAGARVDGHVIEATRPGRVKGVARVGLRFNRLRFGETTYEIRTVAISREAAATKKDDAAKIGVGAGAGAIVGAIAGGKKGAAIGTAVGAGGGTAVVLATRGEDVRLAPGTVLTTRLAESVTVRVH